MARPWIWLWLALAAFAYGGWELWTTRSVRQPPGVVAAAAPAQTPVGSASPPAFRKGDATLEPVARFAPEFPIPRADIETNSANMHLIPADSAIEKRIKSARVGQVVSLSGYLVNVRADDGFAIESSVKRGDTGPGSCEVVWVEEFD